LQTGPVVGAVADRTNCRPERAAEEVKRLRCWIWCVCCCVLCGRPERMTRAQSAEKTGREYAYTRQTPGRHQADIRQTDRQTDS
jgi:hypothetical protein